MSNCAKVKTICPVCSRRCIVEAEVAGGDIASIRPCREEGFAPYGEMCVKGAHGGDYRRADRRLLHPLRRIGKRGEGSFEEISWDEAIDEIAKKLLALREQHGADSVSFFCGYTKWMRPMLQRLCCAFGSVNYGTESSSCQRSRIMANICDSGFQARPDYKNAGVLLATAARRLPPPAKAAAKRGMKIIAVDPLRSPDIDKYADLHLRLRPGTDIALAYAIARELILGGHIDIEYIEKYVHGYGAYKARAMAFTPERAAEICGIEPELITRAAAMIAENGPLCLQEGFTGLIHHRNGMQAVRAWSALTAICGSYGRPGGNIPTAKLLCNGYGESTTGIFDFERPRENPGRRIGAERFPLWNALLDECQAMDFPAAADRGELKAIFALGFNARMFPDSDGMFKTLEKLDFFVNCDFRMTDSCLWADIVLPVSLSYEREQLAFVGRDQNLWLSHPIVEPMGESRSDEDIMIALARAMELDDPLFSAGKTACWETILGNTGITLSHLEASPLPLPIPDVAEPKPLQNGFATPTGRFELYSEAIAACSGLDPLPDYIDPLGDQDRSTYPLTLMAGVRTERYVHALHSRTHTVASLRSIRPEAAVDMHPADMAALGLEEGCRVRLSTHFGAIECGVSADGDMLPGCVNMYHGYSEADVNRLIPGDYLDPYTGFPGYKAIACKIEKI